eukprot:8539076-Prorocentrum_lima.AAC.1
MPVQLMSGHSVIARLSSWPTRAGRSNGCRGSGCSGLWMDGAYHGGLGTRCKNLSLGGRCGHA